MTGKDYTVMAAAELNELQGQISKLINKGFRIRTQPLYCGLTHLSTYNFILSIVISR